MSKEKESPALTDDQIFIKEKLTDIGCVLGFDEDSTWSILPNYGFKIFNLGALLDILQLKQAAFITKLNLSNNEIEAKVVIALAWSLKDTNITTLSLSNNPIGAKGAIALATHLKGTNIAILDLDFDNIEWQGAKSLVENLENTSVQTSSQSFDPSPSYLINNHQQALADRVAKLYREGNKSVSLKTWDFYINMGEAVLQNYLTGIGSTYASDALLQKFKEIWGEDIDKVALESLSEIRVLDLHKLILEYWDRDFKPTPKMYKQLLPTPLDTTIEVVKDEEALTKALTSSLHGRAVITPGDWVSRSINSGSDSSGSSTSTMSSSEMAYSDSVSSSSSYSSSNSYSMSSYYESTPSTTDIPLSGDYEAISKESI